MGWISELILQVHMHFMNQIFSEAGTFFQVTKDPKMRKYRISKVWIGVKLYPCHSEEICSINWKFNYKDINIWG